MLLSSVLPGEYVWLGTLISYNWAQVLEVLWPSIRLSLFLSQLFGLLLPYIRYKYFISSFWILWLNSICTYHKREVRLCQSLISGSKWCHINFRSMGHNSNFRSTFRTTMTQRYCFKPDDYGAVNHYRRFSGPTNICTKKKNQSKFSTDLVEANRQGSVINMKLTWQSLKDLIGLEFLFLFFFSNRASRPISWAATAFILTL